MKTYTCDMCGSKMEKLDTTRAVRSYDGYTVECRIAIAASDVDLCPVCMAEILTKGVRPTQITGDATADRPKDIG